MMQEKTLRLGVAPTRRDSWADKKAFENYEQITAWLKSKSDTYSYEIVDTKTLTFADKEICFGKEIRTMKADTLLSDYEDAVIIANYFKHQSIDALFIPFCDFGQEEAVAKLSKELDVPVLIWGPRDAAPVALDWRPTDTQCGMFAASKVLQRYHVKFTYIENCALNDSLFEKGFASFLRTASIVKEFRQIRILQFSVRPQQFLGVMVNEGELLEKFGVEVVPITTSELFAEIRKIQREEKKCIEKICAEIEQEIDLSLLKEKKEVMSAVGMAMMHLARKYRCTAVACECWHEVVTEFDVSPCFVVAELNERGIPCACEMDIHGAVSSLMAAAAKRFAEPSFLADLTIRHPTDDNTELLWHCGPFARSLKSPTQNGYVAQGGQGFYPLKYGVVTILRFDACDGKYRCFTGCGESIEGPVTNGNYIWLKTDNWSKWENKFVYGPYIHHVSGVFGDFRKEIKEACRYLEIYYDTPETEELA